MDKETLDLIIEAAETTGEDYEGQVPRYAFLHFATFLRTRIAEEQARKDVIYRE